MDDVTDREHDGKLASVISRRPALLLMYVRSMKRFLQSRLEMREAVNLLNEDTQLIIQIYVTESEQK